MRLLLPLLLLAGLAPAQDDLEKIVREQGEELKKLKEEVDRLREKEASRDAADLGEDIDRYLQATEESETAFRAASNRPGLLGRTRLGGYFSLEFRDDGDGSPMTFDQHRLVLLLQSQVSEGITFETESEIEGGGADVSFLSGNEILVEYAELGFEILDDRLIFVAGLVLVPWGRFNSVHDDPMNDLTDRPLVSRYVGAVAFGQPGVAVEGTLELGEGWFFDYDVALLQGFDDGFTTASGARGARQSFRSDNNDNKHVFGRFVVSPPVRFLDVLEVGVSGNVGKHDPAGALSNYGVAADVFLKRGPFELAAEYMNQRVEQPAGAPATDPRRMDGWYVDLIYRFFPAAWRGKHVLFTDESTFAIVVRLEEIDLNHSTDGTAFRDDLRQASLGFNFRPVQRTVFKVAYTWVDSEEPGSGGRSADVFTISWASYF